jgi:hypothetical protein
MIVGIVTSFEVLLWCRFLRLNLVRTAIADLNHFLIRGGISPHNPNRIALYNAVWFGNYRYPQREDYNVHDIG